MLKGVVKDQALTFLPMDNLVSDPDAAVFLGLGDFQRQVIADDALMLAPVRRNMFARSQNREKGYLQSWNLVEQLYSFGTALAVLL